MPLLFLLLVLGVIAITAALVSGRYEAHLAPATVTRPMLALPTGDVSAADVEGLWFSVGLRGYRMDEVDQALDRLRDEIGLLRQEISVRDDELARLRGPAWSAATSAVAEPAPDPAQPDGMQPDEQTVGEQTDEHPDDDAGR